MAEHDKYDLKGLLLILGAITAAASAIGASIRKGRMTLSAFSAIANVFVCIFMLYKSGRLNNILNPPFLRCFTEKNTVIKKQNEIKLIDSMIAEGTYDI